MGILAKRSISSGAAGAAAAQGLSDTRKALGLCRGYATGSTTLIGGTKALTGLGIPSNAVLRFIITTPGGTLGNAYQATGVGTTGGFTVNSLSSTGSLNAADTSTLTWEATWPLFHADQTSQLMSADPTIPVVSVLTVSAATAVDLPTSIALANNLLAALKMHAPDANAHLIADATFVASLAAMVLAVDLPTTITLLNAIKAALNIHYTAAGVHVYNDGINTVATTNASDLPTSETLANALKTAVNAHMSAAPAGESVTILSP